VEEEAALLATLARASAVRTVDRLPADLVAARGIVRGMDVAVPLAGLLDLEAERARLGKELSRLQAEITARSQKLENASFRERAPAEVVEREVALKRDLVDRRDKIQATLRTLGAGGAT
jgi:valyl-tRNA synthetase